MPPLPLCPSRPPCSYNFLLYVPYQLERLILFGFLLCVDCFLVRS